MILFPNAKINIGLNILSKRDDGFHEIDTLMYPILLNDIIIINENLSEGRGKVKFRSTGIVIDGDSANNLIVKAYQLLSKEFNLPAVNIHLHKSIPFGAGLGGGSADCAFTLVGLNSLFSLGLSEVQLENYAAKLGSDCPFFIKNKPAFSRGRGEKLSESNLSLKDYKIAVIIPPVSISTKEAYFKVIPKLPAVSLEQNIINTEIQDWKQSVKNDFEESVFSLKPDIAQIKLKLQHLGAIYTSLSGSGSAVYGIFEKSIDLKKTFPANYFVWTS
ncbi:MAG: 4-(cytidine 5'-diphospho)-2-C-methyl-D-erythritol kinase [Salinivirgaceae bacterium]|nr:4-(cytidine 5'-diphospho)-2-C-methyl-D-erythritol kinase [Salinivirgaceae bacterium]